MTRIQLIQALATAISRHEGFTVTQEQARSRGIKWPTRAQQNCNPGNIRRWSRNGVAYPQTAGYVDFAAWAGGDRVKGLNEGWRILRVLVGQYVDGKYHKGISPTLAQMFAVYAPSADSNDPDAYARGVAAHLGVSPNVSLASLIDKA